MPGDKEGQPTGVPPAEPERVQYVVPPELQQQIADLRAAVEVERAAREASQEALAAQTAISEAQVGALRVAVGSMSEMLKAVGGSYKAMMDRMVLPEKERPEGGAGWVKLVREQVETLRSRGEAQYSIALWEERPDVKRILDAIPPEQKELADSLVKELRTMQKEDKLNSQWLQRCNDFGGEPGEGGLASLLNVASTSDTVVSPDFLRNLSNLPEAEIPSWLEGILGPDQRSMSVQISRAVYLYLGFFGRWSERRVEALDGRGGIEEKVQGDWRAGKFGRDMSAWDKEVTRRLERLDWVHDEGVVGFNREVLEKLGFGTEGRVSFKVLKAMVEGAPPDFKKNSFYTKLRDRAKTAPEAGGLSLLELLVIDTKKIEFADGREEMRPVAVNMFSQSVKREQVAYTRWLVSSLCGSSYAEESAIRFLTYTGHAGKMNGTDAAGTFQGDVSNRLYYPERRRLGEARKGNAAGPIVTLGRYPALCRSWLEKTTLTVEGETKKKEVIDLLLARRFLHKLPWEQLSDGSYTGGFLLGLARAVGAWEKTTGRNIELNGRGGLLSEGDALQGINKKFRDAFLDEWPYKDREAWAKDGLELIKKNPREFNRQEWSPWFTFVFGLIWEHHPDRKLPDDALQSPTGIEMVRPALFTTAWQKNEQGKNSEGRILNTDSVANLLDTCEKGGFLTPSEKALVKVACHI